MRVAADIHPDTRNQLKRIAINVVALLPADECEARYVLEQAGIILRDFLGEKVVRSPFHIVRPSNNI